MCVNNSTTISILLHRVCKKSSFQVHGFLKKTVLKFDRGFRKTDVVLAEVVGVGLSVNVAPDPVREVAVDVQLL